jgi:hypothetical protein
MDLDTFRMTWYLLSLAARQAFCSDLAGAEANLALADTVSTGVDTSAYGTKRAFIALVHIGMGRLDEAMEISIAAAAGPNQESSVPLIAISAAGAADPARAADLQADLDDAPSTRLNQVARRQVAALVAVSEQRWDDARAAFRAALEEFEALGQVLYGSMAALQFEAYLGARFDDARQAGMAAATTLAEGDGTGFVERYRAAFPAMSAPPVSVVPAKARVPVDAEQPA